MIVSRLTGLILPTILAMAGAASFSQFPEFYQQYLQRLGGRLDQAESRLAEITADAETKGMSVEAYIESFLSSHKHALEGQRMLDSFELTRELRLTIAKLFEAQAWERPALLAKHFHSATAEATYAAFSPALPLTLDGVAYAAAGAALALTLSHLLRRTLRRRQRERQRV